MSLMKFDRGMGRKNRFSGFFKDNFFTDDMLTGNDYMPAANIRSSADTYEIQLALPGYKKEAVNISVDNNILTISAEEVKETEITEEFSRMEFYQSSFVQSFELPGDVDEDKLSAKMEDGVLKIKIGRHDHDPKTRKRAIEIK